MPGSVPSPALSQDTAPAVEGVATAILRGTEVPIQCPTWCITDHAAQDVLFIADVSHEGEPISLPVPTFGGPDEHVLRARLCWWPFAADDRGPYLALEAGDDGECAELPPAAALAYADQITAHAHNLRRMATELQKEVA